MATGGADRRRDRSLDRSRDRSREGSKERSRERSRERSVDRSVDSRVVCSVCLEPYRGRQPKLLPCFHTFCLPCLSQLADKGSQGAAGEGEQETGSPSQIITCPTCRTEIPVPPGGVADFQSNFYLADDPDTSTPRTTSATLSPGATAASVTKARDKEEERRDKVRGQVKVLKAVLARLAEEEGEITAQKLAVDHAIQIRYSTALKYLADARDQSLISLRDTAQAAHDKLEAEKSHVEMRLDFLTQLKSGVGPMAQGGLLSDAALRHFQQLAQKKGQHRYFTHSCASEDSAKSMADACHQFMGTVGAFGESAKTTQPAGLGTAAENPATDDQLRQTTNAIGTEVLKLRQELAALQTHNSQLDKKLGEVLTVREDVASLLSDNTKLTRDVNIALAENTKLARDLSTLRQDFNTALADTTKLVKDVGTLQIEMNGLSKYVTTTQAETSRLSKDLGTMQTDLSDLSKTVTTVQAETSQFGTQKINSDVQGLMKNVTDLQKTAIDLQTENKKVGTEFSTVKTDMDQLKQELATSKTDSAKLGTDVQTTHDEMKQKMAALQDLLEKSSREVAFCARLQRDMTTKASQVLILPDVVTNVGGAYDPQTGIFTAPVSGTYLFLATIDPGENCNSAIRIVLENKEYGNASTRTEHNSTTGHTVLSITKGLRVWLRSGTFTTNSFCGDGWTYFCGVLIQANMQQL